MQKSRKALMQWLKSFLQQHSLAMNAVHRLAMV